MADITLATAADYADAMITARRAKNWLFLLLLLILLIQLGVFFGARYTDVIIKPSPTSLASTQSSVDMRDVLRYLVGLSDFLGIALVIVLAIVLQLTVQVMLVARVIGVSRVTSAFVWCIVLAVLLFPWQAFLDPYVFKLPGVLYTWDELIRGARFSTATIWESNIRWARFVVMPVAALIVLLAIQIKSTRGVRLALGEGVVHANDRASDA